VQSEEFTWKREEPSFYGGDELHKIKAEKVQKSLEKYDFDALLLFQSPAVRYVTDFFVKGYRSLSHDLEYLAIVPRGKEPILGFQSGSDEYRVKTKCLIEDTRRLGSYNKWPESIAGILVDYGLTKGRIGVDMLLFDWYLALKKKFPKIEFVNAHRIWAEITAIKHPIEIEYIRKAQEIAMKGLLAGMEAVKDGIRETEVEAAEEYAMRMAGCEIQLGIHQVASGKNSAIFERIATDKVIKDGELVILDIGATYRGYLGDTGRTTICGTPTKKQMEIFRVQLGSLRAALEAIKPGVTCSEVDRAAKQFIIDAGYGKYMHKFATGHQLGYGLHGEPMIAKGVEETLRPNMVVCLEPRVHLYDQWDVGGVHNEEAVLVTETGAEKLVDLKYCEKLLGS
jgi:Xaa-Pro aminopeptidase